MLFAFISRRCTRFIMDMRISQVMCVMHSAKRSKKRAKLKIAISDGRYL